MRKEPVLRSGSTGAEVEALQERLRELGYDRPGFFGPVTEFAVRRFQEAHGLLPDGEVGPATRPALAEGRARVMAFSGGGPAVDRSLRLSPSQVFAEGAGRAKDLIVLHHTVGGSARSTFDWWERGDSARIATAYLLERDGTVHEVFDPRFWAYHLGLRGTGGAVDRRSIGIELACEGPLERADEVRVPAPRFEAFGRAFTGEVYDHGEPWRGHRYWAAYTPSQVDSVIALVDHLCNVFAVPRQTPAHHLEASRELWNFRGILGHHQLRADKSDLHPGFPWERLVSECSLDLVGPIR